MTIAKRLLAGLAILWAFSVCAGAESAPINGFYYQDELSNPLPGALIALYKADDNTLIAYTYTRNDGAFTLRGPSVKGKYYIVATKDQFSHKLDFDYDPEAFSNLMIQHHQPTSTWKIIKEYVGGRFVEALNLLIGLAIGFGWKIVEDRKKARQTILREIKTVEDSSADILTNYVQLEQIARDYGRSDSTAARPRREAYIVVAREIGTQAEALQKELDANTALEEAVYTLHKLSGRNQYAAVRRAARDIKKTTDTIVENNAAILDAPAANREAILRPFLTLRESTQQLNK